MYIIYNYNYAFRRERERNPQEKLGTGCMGSSAKSSSWGVFLENYNNISYLPTKVLT